MRDQEQLGLLVDEIGAFLQAWQTRLRDAVELGAGDSAHAATAERLGARARAGGIGGLAHHLQRCAAVLRDASPNLRALRESLRAVSEISWQLREELRRSQHRAGDPNAAPPLLDVSGSLAAPPLLSPALAASLARAASEARSAPLPPARSPRLLETLLGLRAFGRSTTPSSALRGSAPATPSAPQGLFGFRVSGPKRPPMAPPPLLSMKGALPKLSAPAAAPNPVLNVDLRERLRPLRPSSPRGERRDRARAGRGGTAPPAGRRHALHANRFSWGFVLVITIPAGLLLGNAFLILDHHLRSRTRPAETVSLRLASAPETAAGAPGGSSAPAVPRQWQELTKRIHGSGGEESPELAALLDAEAGAAYQTISRGCADSAACEGQLLARDLLTQKPLHAATPRPAGPPPRWLAGLELPVIGAQDHPEVQRWLEYYTNHTVGRELFQTMLFRCGAHRDSINKALVHSGLPPDLMAVVLTESACVVDAESPVGARGLWQFMPRTARAYHLHVQEGVVDERLSPVKSTAAAVRYLADLHRKMGSWEMAFASYNAGSGPFRILARLQQAGASASFWDLADAQLIPSETARYVPRIQAYALILANLQHFDFATAQMRTAEETADLEAPPGTRLGQVARAAGTSVSYLRALNPDLVATVVPHLPGSRFVLQVPKSSAFRARETLGQFSLDQLDLCVSSAFDWGREQFTAQMQAKCTARRPR